MKALATSKKRLAIVCTHPIQYYVPFFQELSRMISVKVFFTQIQSNKKRYDPGFKKRIEWNLPMLDGYNYVFAGSMAIKMLEAFGADKILIYGWPFPHHLCILRHFKNKIWFRGDSVPLVNEHLWRSCLKTLCLKWVYRHVDKAFYVGSRNKSYFLKYGLLEEQLVFAPHAIDNVRFGRIDKAKVAAIRMRFHIQETDLLILFAGKLNTNKNPFLLLQAFCSLNRKDVHLLFAGDGTLKDALVKSVDQLPNVHLLPFQNQNEMPALYHCCDLFCLPSKAETWGLSINEAMAAGKAILVSNAAGAAADLISDDNGQMFQSDNLHDLQSKLQKMLSSKGQLRALGQQGKRKIQNWSFKRQAQILIVELNQTK